MIIPAAMGDFWRARDQWQSSWSNDPENHSLVVYVLPDSLVCTLISSYSDSIKMWQLC